jgi:hypothetical protein
VDFEFTPEQESLKNDVQAFATGEPGPGGVTYKVYLPK